MLREPQPDNKPFTNNYSSCHPETLERFFIVLNSSVISFPVFDILFDLGRRPIIFDGFIYQIQ